MFFDWYDYEYIFLFFGREFGNLIGLTDYLNDFYGAGLGPETKSFESYKTSLIHAAFQEESKECVSKAARERGDFQE